MGEMDICLQQSDIDSSRKMLRRTVDGREISKETGLENLLRNQMIRQVTLT
jgi:hypothetical protein